ncbi:MAG: MBOAT family protein [Bacteroidetes bacterium]|nr:MBOAT family protein [Bacteroidota bacterium]
MLFNSVHFFFFFLIVTSFYFISPHKYRWFILLLASCYFYMAFVPMYILILAFTIVVDYFAGIFLEKAGSKKKKFLILSLVVNIGILAVFKYYNFINENISLLLSNFGVNNPIPYLKILLPIGLSFHTFQAMSYTIEVYRGNQKAERNFGIYALYVMFYPQLVAGPIERPQNILHQFYEKKTLNYEDVAAGLKLMLWGFFQKLVIADRLSIYVDAAYNNPQNHSGITLLLASVFFAFQIYCDFAGYSNIALGVARVMGFRLMVNFKRPYFSTSISEFWRRWHISLSSWFTDYLYIPLGGNRVSVPRWYFNLFFVFLVSGLWHGANWTFIIWGAINGLYLIFSIIFKKPIARISSILQLNKFPKLLTVIQIFITFFLAVFAWTFFRANSITDASLIIKKIFTFKGPLFAEDPFLIMYSIIGISILLIREFFLEFYPGISLLNNKNVVIRYATYTGIIMLILMIGVFDGGQFIYFQF